MNGLGGSAGDAMTGTMGATMDRTATTTSATKVIVFMVCIRIFADDVCTMLSPLPPEE